MPRGLVNKSKVPQRVSASQKPRAARKTELVEEIRELVEEYSHVYVFDLVNSRTALLKQVRAEFKDEGRFIFGKSKVMQVALGRTEEEALRPNLDKLGKKLSGSTCGLFFTNLSAAECKKRFKAISELDYARSGFTVSRTVELKAGPIIGQPSSMLEPLRDLKLPVVLKKGIIELERDHIACSAGDVLTVEQAKVLKLFGIMLSEFRVRLLWRWDAKNGKLTQLESSSDMEIE